MVYIAALLFGHGAPVVTEEDSGVADMVTRYLLRLTSSVRRGSVDSCDGRDNRPPARSLDAGPEVEERQLQQEVTRLMERLLTEAKASCLQCQVLLLPRHLTARVGQDVVRASADEPCGLRGASIRLYVECKDGLRSAGSFSPDPSLTPTFELSVIFRADKDGGWNIFDSGKVLKLRGEYRLVKRKLYSSATPVIHDFR